MLIALKLLGSIALLIFGMKMMSEALQKMAGPQLRHLLGAMTTNRLTGVATGALVTVAVQSSAATTVMTVSFVNAALLTLAQAISIIMGANIGTTMSAWIMSAGFSFNVVNVVWPAFLIGIILIQIGKHRYFGDFLFGLSFLLFALGMLKQTGVEMDLASKPEVVAFFASFKTNYGTILLFLLIGTILTALVQSSAALMAITMVLCATGAISIFQGIALVMGENIGTTVTANLAALSANTQARRTAMAHLVFNVFGVIWVLILFFPFVRMVCGIVGLDPNVQAQKEIAVFGENTQRMFEQVRELYATEDEQAFGKLFDRLRKGEEGSDRMENEIGRYLSAVGEAHLSDETKEKIRGMLRQIGELESVGLARMNTVLAGHKEDFGIGVSEDLERRINACRNELKQQNIENLDAHKYDYDKGTVFVDIFSECEKTGDYIINVVEARLGVNH